jgi:hypothetical protein
MLLAMAVRTRLGIAIALLMMISPLYALLSAAELGKMIDLPVDSTGDRFFVTLVTVKGESLRLYTDSGGGLFLHPESVKRLGLPVRTIREGGNQHEVVAFPELRQGVSVPAPMGNHGYMPVLSAAEAKRLPEGMDGMLGQAWFSGRVWTWDYPGQRLLWLPEGGLPVVSPQHRIALGFKTDESGKRLNDFPRITVTIDGERLDLLFDTGATVGLSPGALAHLDDKGPSSRGTSFITETHFERWRQRHPDWPVIENADLNHRGEPMIQVPSIELAGYTVGPVWFTCRPNSNFHQFMSQWMDRQVEGALGGSALRFFRITIDYPNAVAVFERPGIL